MTFYELYQQYLNKYTAPQQGIMSIQPVTPVGESGGDGSPSPGMTAGPTGTIGFSNPFSDLTALDVALGLMNPVGLAVSLGARAVGLPSLQDIGKMAMNAVGFGDSSSTGTANATDTGDMGSEAANNAATAAANAAAAAAGGDSSGGGADGGGPGGGDSGDTGGPFRDGGRATLYDGGSAFDNYNAPEYMSLEVEYNFPDFKEWMKENREGGIMDLLDEYNRQKQRYEYEQQYPRDKAAYGGRIGYLQGGLASLLG